MFSWLLKLFPSLQPKLELGALIDERPAAQREAEDIKIEQVAKALVPVTWTEIPKEKVRFYGMWIQNQTGKSDCVAETRRKLKRILFFVNKGLTLDFSAVAFYRKRSNYPRPGMIATDAMKLDSEQGMTLDALVPSEPVTTEAAANALQPEAFNDEVAKVFRTADVDVVFDPGDLDAPAGTIQKTRKGVMMWFFATYAEWSQEVPTIIDKLLTSPSHPRAVVVHSVPGIEPAIYKGKQGVWIDDSAHFGGFSRRFITREFYEKRNFWASYPITFKFEVGTGSKPKYDKTIISVQKILRYEGMFPTNIDYVENLGPVTRKGLREFQAKYKLPETGELDTSTIVKLKSLYP